MEEGGSFTEACRLFNEVYAFGKEAVDLIAEKLRTLMLDEEKRIPHLLICLMKDFADSRQVRLIEELLLREEIVMDSDSARFHNLSDTLSRVNDGLNYSRS